MKLAIGQVMRVLDENRIVETLDENGRCDGLPFTAEMRRLCGRSFPVRSVPNRIHIDGFGVHGIRDAYIIDTPRCNGRAHGGCGRACNFFFRSRWLEPATNPIERSGSPRHEPPYWASTCPCQGNSPVLLKITFPLSARRLSQYASDLRWGNWGFSDVLSMTLLRLNRNWSVRDPVWDVLCRRNSIGNVLRLFGALVAQRLIPRPQPQSVDKPARFRPLELQQGDFVFVKSAQEILETLDSNEKHRGLGFVGSMLPWCGKRLRVRAVVDSLIDGPTGRSVTGIKNTVLLEDCVCSGLNYRGCLRRCYWLWREDWLTRNPASQPLVPATLEETV